MEDRSARIAQRREQREVRRARLRELGGEDAAPAPFMDGANDEEDHSDLGDSRPISPMSGRSVGGAEEAKVTGDAAARAALEALDLRKARGMEHTTGVRLEAAEREELRRTAEEHRRLERLHRVQEEALASEKANTAVELRWRDLGEHNMPLELHREIESQRAACDAILASKDELIREFQAELKAKDEEYVKGLQRQRTEIDDLLSRMDAQFREMKEAYASELRAVEEAFSEERRVTLEGQEEELRELMRRRQEAEERYTADRLKAEEEYAKALDAVQAADADEYTKLKVKLETDIQTLEQQLSVMRATYLLNQEKLDYNYRVLIEREADNEEAATAQKDKVKRLERALQRVTKEYQDADKFHREKNAALTTEFRRVTKQFRELQTKAGRFAATDAAKYAQVREMHAQELQGMMARLVDADRVITEQVLGWEWEPPAAIPELPKLPPPKSIFQAPEDVAAAGGGGGGVLLGGEEGGESSSAGSIGKKKPTGVSSWSMQTAERAFSDEVVSVSTTGHGGQESKDEGVEREEEEEEEEEEERGDLGRVLEREKYLEWISRTRVFLELAFAEANFLIPASKSDASPVERGAAVLHALGITNDAMLTSVLNVFFSDSSSSSSSISPTDHESTSPSSSSNPKKSSTSTPYDIARRSLRVSPEAVVPTLRGFLEAKAAAQNETSGAPPPTSNNDQHSPSTAAAANIDTTLLHPDAASASASGYTAGGGGGGGHTTTAGTPGIAGTHSDASFWTQAAAVIPDRTVRIWQALETGLEKYHKTLQDRSQLLDSVDDLREQNDQLRALLQQYLTADVNRSMQVAPAATLALAPEK